jgi:hypothetical protein
MERKEEMDFIPGGQEASCAAVCISIFSESKQTKEEVFCFDLLGEV